MSDQYTHFTRTVLSRAWPTVALVMLAGAAQGQTAPDAGSLMREAERQPRALPAPAVLPSVPQATPAPSEDAVRVLAKAFEFSGNKLLAQSDLQAAVAPWLGRELSFSELQHVIEAVTQTYRQRGWFVLVKLPAQDVSEGTIHLQIMESRLGQIRIDAEGKDLRIQRDVLIGAMTARQQVGEPLNMDAIDRGGSLINDLPGVTAATVLAAGQEAGTSDVIVKVQDKSLWSGSVQLDNTGSRSTGDQKLSFSGSVNNPGGIGDQISLNTSATEGSHYFRAGYTLPVGHDGWRLGVNASTLDYKLIGPDFAALNAKGDAQTQGLQLSYPLWRGGLENVTFGAAYDWKTYDNAMNGLQASYKHIHVGTLSLNGDHLDDWGNGGMTLWGTSVTTGRLDLSGNANNQSADQSGPHAEGQFDKFSANIARLQRLTSGLSLWASVNAQRAGKNLDSSEKMSLGGPSGVRAYPVMEAVGDDGMLSTLEMRYSLDTEWQLTAFYDYGRIHRDHNASYPGAPELQNVALAGRGVGVNWTQPGQWAVRAALAHRNGSNPLANQQNGTDQDGSLKKYRLWLTGIFSF